MAGENEKQLMNAVVIYASRLSPRLEYIARTLSAHYNLAFTVITDATVYREHQGACINYSNEGINEHELHIAPVGLLFEKNIHPLGINCFTHPYGFSCFFESAGETGFDIFAAIFFLLSRYEEYLPHEKDIYGRYAFENSIAHKNNFLGLPLVDEWLAYLQQMIASKFTDITFASHHFSFQPTYDIDIAWSYANKGISRSAGGMIQQVLNRKFDALKNRIAVLAGKQKDPFDSYQWLDEVHKQHQLKPIYFIHAGMNKSMYDKNISPANHQWKKLVASLSARYQTGLHPSWYSGDHPEAISREKSLLENVSGKKVIHSRQHYIRFSLPQTFRHLLNAGIRHDHSMGYGSINGFRASYSRSFFWYDLEREETTGLQLHPFCFMDANSFYEQKQSAAETLDELLSYYTKLKNCNGRMITIWHNNFLGSDPLYKGWREVYLKFLQAIAAAWHCDLQGKHHTK